MIRSLCSLSIVRIQSAGLALRQLAIPNSRLYRAASTTRATFAVVLLVVAMAAPFAALQGQVQARA